MQNQNSSEVGKDLATPATESPLKRAGKFLLKQRSITAAKRNPFRPRQTSKKGKWRTLAAFASLLDAMTEYRRISTRGMYDRGVFYKGDRITNEHHMLPVSQQDRFGVDAVGNPKPPKAR